MADEVEVPEGGFPGADEAEQARLTTEAVAREQGRGLLKEYDKAEETLPDLTVPEVVSRLEKLSKLQRDVWLVAEERGQDRKGVRDAFYPGPDPRTRFRLEQRFSTSPLTVPSDDDVARDLGLEATPADELEAKADKVRKAAKRKEKAASKEAKEKAVQEDEAVLEGIGVPEAQAEREASVAEPTGAEVTEVAAEDAAIEEEKDA